MVNEPSVTRFTSLGAWLAWQETLHPSAIDLGLERVSGVAASLGVSPGYVVVTVGGTNGKGSTIALLEAILTAAGYRVGAYTSPHLLRYNERIRIAGTEVDDAALCATFERIDRARGETSLTYFEFGTLAALDIFQGAGLDVALLEVGMGGRLDAVNVVDPDVAIVTTVDVDHVQWLGEDREAIGREKAGIFRRERPAVYADAHPPRAVLEHAAHLGARLHCMDGEFGYRRRETGWDWWGPQGPRTALPEPALRGRAQLKNAAGALAALGLLAERLPITQAHVREGLHTARLAGRLQVIPGAIPQVLDIAHNPQATAALADSLRAMACGGRTLAVVAMLADKDIEAALEPLTQAVHAWHVAGLAVPRGAGPERLVEALAVAGGAPVTSHATVAEARRAALAAAAPGDQVVVFGSFHTVAEALGETL